MAACLHKLQRPVLQARRLRAVEAALVRKVRRRAVLRRRVHRRAADLDFHSGRLLDCATAAWRAHGHVQRLVAVGLGPRDVVLAAAGQRLPECRDEALDVVTSGLELWKGGRSAWRRVDNDAHAEHVVHLGRRAAASLEICASKSTSLLWWQGRPAPNRPDARLAGKLPCCSGSMACAAHP